MPWTSSYQQSPFILINSWILPRAVKSTDFNKWIYPFSVYYCPYHWWNKLGCNATLEQYSFRNSHYSCYHSVNSPKTDLQVSLDLRRQFIPWKLLVRWKFLNRKQYPNYFTCKSRQLAHEPQKNPPVFLTYFLMVNNH
jgi:hypothetical protein